MVGALNSFSAIKELEKKIQIASSTQELQIAARARYIIGFIKRVLQYKQGKASSIDLCLNLRDLILVLGRIRLNAQLLTIVKENSNSFHFIIEDENVVNCALDIPQWITDPQFIRETYALTFSDTADFFEESVGDIALKKYTKFQNYKSFEQKLAVKTASILPLGHTLLISLPTGGGKSLITQLLSTQSMGLTLVIVPTVALAMDQYHAANNNLHDKTGIYCYRGEQSENDKQVIFNGLARNDIRLLFISPEAIVKNKALCTLLERAAENGYLQNIVIDEAHIVPDWGIFFRPDFQIFSIILKRWKAYEQSKIRTFLLSATLSDDVVETLFFLFGDSGKNVQLRCDELRKEPRFCFYAAKSKAEQTEKTLEAIKLLPKPMVVYVLEPEEATELKKSLSNLGYQNIPIFTGETKDKEREEILQAWKQHMCDIVLATSAFGIGVDKPDVRTIIHACVPENLSRFYQEVGRGGRDRLPSLSVFIPYQSNTDGEGDLHRALGLVKSRVLTVKVSVIRWQSLLNSPTTIINGDNCIFDTSTPPSSMTPERAEVTGNLNISWNINLLLFLHRTGFINLIDAEYVPNTKSYIITVKLLKPTILSDSDSLTDALQEPRQRELDLQLHGYRLMRNLVQRPTSTCWGHIFKNLYPLSREVCNGCPVDQHGKQSSDSEYKLRLDPELQLPPHPVSRKLDRKMGTYIDLIIQNWDSSFDVLTVQTLCDKACSYGIGTLVLPRELYDAINFDGIIYSYEEFYFSVIHTPYLFCKGVLCIFSNNAMTNNILYKNLSLLKKFGYRVLLYCNDQTIRSTNGKPLSECLDGYRLTPEKL